MPPRSGRGGRGAPERPLPPITAINDQNQKGGNQMRTIAAAFGALVACLITSTSLAQVAVSGAGGDTNVRAKAVEAETLVAKLESASRNSQQKSVASGLYMSGVFTYALGGGSASINLDRINNDSFTATT